jgi:hypothetical protein
MRLLERMTLGQRIMLSAAIAIAVILALALFGYLTGAWEEDGYLPFSLASAESKSELCMDGETRERVRRLMYEALDEALKKKVEDLFAVWLRDSTGQPQRAQKGMDGALRAYYGARGAAAKFNPPDCSG